MGGPAMKVAIVGSRALRMRGIAAHLLKTLVALPDGTIVLLRRGRTTEPGEFEMVTQVLCSELHIAIEWCVPERGGREAVYLRDIDMVSRADAVIAYFPADAVMTGGTGHVVEKAMDADKAVYAYAPDDQDRVDWVGGNEPAIPVGLNL